MADSIFNIQPPAWLTEITTGDVTKPERESFGQGIQIAHQRVLAQHYANEEQLTGLRAQALMLQSQARIQALESANASAAMKLEISQGHLALANAKLDFTKQIATEKATDFQGFLDRRKLLTPEQRAQIDEVNPSWSDPATGPNSQQRDMANDFIIKNQQAAGLQPTEVQLGPHGATQTFKSASGAESPIGKLYADREKARSSGNLDAVKNFDAAIAEATTNKGRSIYVGMDDKGMPIFQMTEGGATVGMQTQAQEKLAQYQNSLQLMNSLQHQLKPSDVGISGSLGEMVVDKTLAQFMPGVAVGSRIDARTALKVLRSSLMRQVPDAQSGRFSSVADREEVDAALPETGWHESYPDVMQKLDTLKQTLQNRAKTYSTAIGKQVPTWALSKEEIKRKFDAGEITREEAMDALTKIH